MTESGDGGGGVGGGGRAADVSVQIDADDGDDLRPQTIEIARTLRSLTFDRFVRAISPIVEHVNHSALSPIYWLNNNNNNNVNENDLVPPNNTSATTINQNENSLSLNLGTQSEIQNLNIQHENYSDDSDRNHDRDVFPRVDTDSNSNQNNRTVDLNVSEYIPVLFKFTFFILILMIKFIFDHLEGAITFVCMQIVCMFIGDEQTNLRIKSTLRIVLNFIAIVKCLEYIFTYEDLPLTVMIYNPNYEVPTNIWNLLWIIYMNDCIIQFITMGVKLLFKCLPLKIMAFKTKLKVYSFFEALSQLYRSIIPMQSWYFYFLNSYQGNDRLQSILLCLLYSLLKLIDLRKVVSFNIAAKKLFKRSGISSLSKEQLVSKGIKCSICLDDFDHPIQLSCQHIFCSTCIQQWSVKKRSCPLCRTPMNEDFASASITSSVYLQLF